MVTPIVAMKAGVDLQRYVDILVPDSATLKLVSGSGPITLVGSHCVDFYDYRCGISNSQARIQLKFQGAHICTKFVLGGGNFLTKKVFECF